jgi:hypothetical protein
LSGLIFIDADFIEITTKPKGFLFSREAGLNIVLPQIRLNNSFCFGKGTHPREALFAI